MHEFYARSNCLDYNFLLVRVGCEKAAEFGRSHELFLLASVGIIISACRGRYFWPCYRIESICLVHPERLGK